MAKAPKPIQEVARLLDLVPYLAANPYVEISELAREFGVTEREITQEVAALAYCGLPGYSHLELMDVSISDGRVTLYNYDTLDIPRALTKLEIASFLLGLELLREKSSEYPELLGKIDQLISQLTSLVGEIVAVEVGGEAREVAIIQSAIAHRSTIVFHYASVLNSQLRERKVSPLDIYRQGAHTYLKGYCQESGDLRTFRLDRMSGLSKEEGPFTQIDASTPIDAPQHSLHLIAHGHLRAVSEALSLEKVEKDREFTYLAFSPEWVEYAAVALAPDLELLAPSESRERVAHRLANILALYRS
jgi:predicted DNA-binding transcriptional regulator YafY